MLKFGDDAPPPLPPPGEMEATKIIVADLSIGIASIIGLGFCICAYCFFREDLINAKDKLKQRTGKKGGGKGGHGSYGVAASDSPNEDGERGKSAAHRKSSRRDRKKGNRRGGNAEAERAAGHVHVRFETSSLTLKRQVHVGIECADLPTLHEALTLEFGAQLKETRVEQMLLLSECPELDERGDDCRAPNAQCTRCCPMPHTAHHLPLLFSFTSLSLSLPQARTCGSVSPHCRTSCRWLHMVHSS